MRRGSEQQIVMDPAELAKGPYPLGMAGEGRQGHWESLSREETTQISPFANHSGCRVESRLEMGKREAGEPLRLEGVLIAQGGSVVVWTRAQMVQGVLKNWR